MVSKMCPKSDQKVVVKCVIKVDKKCVVLGVIIFNVFYITNVFLWGLFFQRVLYNPPVFDVCVKNGVS